MGDDIFPVRPFDFARDDARQLFIENDNPEELFRAVEALPQWTARALTVSDAALGFWASRVHARPRDREGLSEIHRLIQRLQVIRPADAHPPELSVSAWYHRWNGMAALLEHRARAADRHDPSEIATRAHMPALRQALGDQAGEITTETLRQSLKLSAPRLRTLIEFNLPTHYCWARGRIS